MWGFLPIYWKLFGLFGNIPAVEVLCHRMIWSAGFTVAVLGLQKRWGEYVQLWKSPRILVILLATTSLLALNWGIYIYGVNIDRVLETSLGYFISPLFNVLLGAIFLKESLNRWQGAAVALATIGVAIFIHQLGVIPWIALGLASTFGSYGLIRKVTPVTPLAGLALETSLATPIALAFVAHWTTIGTSHFGAGIALTALFLGCSLATSLPLICYNNAAKRLPFSTLGFLQYFAPSAQLLLGVFLFGEPFTPTHAMTFACIWTGLAIYSGNLFWLKRR
jgi:chloramphenicol-sensitive protein RarD